MFRYLVGSVGKFLECVAFYLKPLACAFCESFFVTVIIPGLFTSISFFDFIRSCTGVSTIISKSKNQLLLSGLSGTATCSEEYFTPPPAGQLVPSLCWYSFTRPGVIEDCVNDD
jgi:hypothetical protein